MTTAQFKDARLIGRSPKPQIRITPDMTIREILNMSGYTDHPSHIVHHRFIVGPDGCGVGHYTAKHVLGLIDKEQAR